MNRVGSTTGAFLEGDCRRLSKGFFYEKNCAIDPNKSFYRKCRELDIHGTFILGSYQS